MDVFVQWLRDMILCFITARKRSFIFTSICQSFCSQGHAWQERRPLQRTVPIHAFQFAKLFSASSAHVTDETLSFILSFTVRSRDQGRLQDFKEGASDLKGVATYYYHPQTKLRKDNVFTSVCQEFCPQGRGCLPQCIILGYTAPWADTPRGRHPHLAGTPEVNTPHPSRRLLLWTVRILLESILVWPNFLST